MILPKLTTDTHQKYMLYIEKCTTCSLPPYILDQYYIRTQGPSSAEACRLSWMCAIDGPLHLHSRLARSRGAWQLHRWTEAAAPVIQ